MNSEARLHPERTEWNVCLKLRYFCSGISRGNNLHFVFFSQFNTLFQLTYALRRMTWKLMGYSFIFHPLDYLCPQSVAPFWWQKQTLNCLRFHWLVNFCYSSSIKRWLPPRSYFSHCTKDTILLPKHGARLLLKWEQRGKSPKQRCFTSLWDYSMTEQGTSEI